MQIQKILHKIGTNTNTDLRFTLQYNQKCVPKQSTESSENTYTSMVHSASIKCLICHQNLWYKYNKSLFSKKPHTTHSSVYILQALRGVYTIGSQKCAYYRLLEVCILQALRGVHNIGSQRCVFQRLLEVCILYALRGVHTIGSQRCVHYRLLEVCTLQALRGVYIIGSQMCAYYRLLEVCILQALRGVHTIGSQRYA